MEHALTDSGPDAPIDPEATNVEVSQQVVGRSPWELFWRRFRRDKFAIGGAFIVIMIFAIAILAPVIAGFTHGPNEVHLDRLDEFGIPIATGVTDPFEIYRLQLRASQTIFDASLIGRLRAALYPAYSPEPC